MKAVLCPVCSGKGSIFTPDTYSTGGGETKVCHGCAGKGWVEVHEDIAIPGYYPCYYIPHYPWHRPYNPYETTSP